MTAGAGQGWYSDPTGRHQLRWWTGTAWAAAVGDDGVQSFDADGLVADRPLWPRAEPTADDHAEVLATCAAGSLPGDDPLSAAVLVIWRRRNAMVDLFPTWSVHDGAGTWLGTVVLEVAGPTPNDRRFVMHRPDATSVVVVVEPPVPPPVPMIPAVVPALHPEPTLEATRPAETAARRPKRRPRRSTRDRGG